MTKISEGMVRITKFGAERLNNEFNRTFVEGMAFEAKTYNGGQYVWSIRLSDGHVILFDADGKWSSENDPEPSIEMVSHEARLAPEPTIDWSKPVRFKDELDVLWRGTPLVIEYTDMSEVVGEILATFEDSQGKRRPIQLYQDGRHVHSGQVLVENYTPKQKVWAAVGAGDHWENSKGAHERAKQVGGYVIECEVEGDEIPDLTKGTIIADYREREDG